MDTWKCWTDDRSDTGTLRVLRNHALTWIAKHEDAPSLVEWFDKILRDADPQLDEALNSLQHDFARMGSPMTDGKMPWGRPCPRTEFFTSTRPSQRRRPFFLTTTKHTRR